MAVGAALFVLVLLVSLTGGLVLYAFVRGEHDRGASVSRADAERLARRDTSEDEDRHPP